MNRPTFLSLFAGIGGLDLGLERAGWECVGQVEIDPYCQRVLAQHWPDVPRWGDIKELHPDELPRADLIAGGFPCQPVSVAGRGLAQEDPRWLWPHVARLVRRLEPRWVLLENVPGLLARGMGDVLGDLATIRYDAEWDCVPASAVGAPHQRDRVWIVGYPQRGGRVGADHGQREHDAPRRPERAAPFSARVAGEAGSEPGVLADANGTRRPAGTPRAGRQVRNDGWRQGSRGLGSEVADPDGSGRGPGSRLGWPRPTIERDGWWSAEPDVGRVAHGIPARVDRLRTLGNAVVPQVAEHIGRLILHHDLMPTGTKST